LVQKGGVSRGRLTPVLQRWTLIMPKLWPSLRATTRQIAQVCVSCAVIAVIALAPASMPAQVVIPAEALVDETGFQRILDRGHELEAQQEWAKALSHYEDALRHYPDRRDLRERLTYARINFDLGRRYEDRSYVTSLNSMTERQALALYAEVLRKIESHYYKQPDWQEVALRGISAFDIALSRARCRDQNGVQASVEAVNAFRNEIRQRMEVTVIRNQRQAHEVAANVATLAAQQIGLRPAATIMEFACGAACGLDQYSCFLTGSQLDDVLNQIEGSFVGLGIELKARQKSLEIISVISGSPAGDAGIRAGERIVEIDGISTEDISTDEAADRLKGGEGSAVHVKVVDSQGGVRQIRLVRRRVRVPSVEDAEIADGDYGIAYLRLASFQKTTSRDLDAVLWQLHRQGMQSLIVDVRSNPGGLLPAAVDAADKFVSSGNIVSTRGRNEHESFVYHAHTAGTWQVPLVVLIDGDTASASEIFASAIGEHHRGTVIGERSYGKGSVQGIFSLSTSKAGIRLTTSKFYSPNEHAISNRGVYPDIAIQTAKKPITEGPTAEVPEPEDKVLNAALQFARSRLSSRQPFVAN
jgi:carboxyl-terminal processing protease